MTSECLPIATLPGLSRLFLDFAGDEPLSGSAQLRSWYPTDPFSMEWAGRAGELSESHRAQLASALRSQAELFAAGPAVLANIELLRSGGLAVVTGQQVGLFGGPLLTLLKAATAIRKAKDATALSGRPHVPIFWLASEDHDLAEVNQVTVAAKTELQTFHLDLAGDRALPVGPLKLDGGSESGPERLEAELGRVCDALGWSPICDTLRQCYRPGSTLATAFGRLLTQIFATEGLIVLDAAGRKFHRLGAEPLRFAIESAAELEEDLLHRSEELVQAGYHAQVLVTAGHSLLFLIDSETGARLPLRRTGAPGSGAEWKAGSRTFSSADLIDVLHSEPERLSPNALLRPVFQDAILPTAAYIGGPAEIAYFAQSAVLYQRILGRVTPVLPRLSATIVEPQVANIMAEHELQFAQVIEAGTIDALTLRFGVRAMPIEAKRKLAAAGNSLDVELAALTEYMAAVSSDLGRAAGVSASKMRYQMNRLRRLAAAFQVQKSTSLRKQATTVMLQLLPDRHLQERVLAGVFFLARLGETLPQILIEQAGQECPGHRVLYMN